MKYAEIHCHTIYSNLYKNTVESLTTPRQLILEAKKNRLSAVAITDHNTLEGYRHVLEFAKELGIVLIPAEEIDTDGNGQILAYGIKKEIKPYRKPSEIIHDVKNDGGIAIIPHPFDIIRGMENFEEVVKLADGIEIKNFGAFHNKMSENYAIRNNVKIRTCGSDAHYCKLVGTVRLGFPDNIRIADDYLKCLRANEFKIETTRNYSQALLLGGYNILLTRTAKLLHKKIHYD
jgi:predicted metal-dependent phosphoesterase TrpH